jgi:hypothetical protein
MRPSRPPLFGFASENLKSAVEGCTEFSAMIILVESPAA